jgi:hypothetical protein
VKLTLAGIFAVVFVIDDVLCEAEVESRSFFPCSMKKARDFQGNHNHAKIGRKRTAPHNATPFIFDSVHISIEDRSSSSQSWNSRSLRLWSREVRERGRRYRHIDFKTSWGKRNGPTYFSGAFILP